MPKRNYCFAVERILRATAIGAIFVVPRSDVVAADGLDRARHRLSVTAGSLQVDISGAAGAGTIIPAGPGSEQPSRLSPDRVNANGGGIEYAFNTGKHLPAWLDATGRTRDLTLIAGWNRYSGDDTATGSVLPGGVATGLLFTRPPSPTGYFPGAAGLESSATTDVDYGRLEVGMHWLQSIDALPARVRFRPQLAFGWTQFDYRVTTLDTFSPEAISPNDYRDERDQYMQQDIFDLQIGGELEQKFGSRGQYTLFGSAGLVTYFLKASLSSFEYVTLAGNTRLRWVGEGERDLFLGAEFGLGVGWQITPDWHAGLSASYSPWVPTATIMNPVSVSDPAPRTYVASDSKANATLLAALTFGF